MTSITATHAAIRDLWRYFQYNSQFRNSLYVMAATAIMSGLGFVFWIICSRLYTPTEIGLATSLVSVASLLTTFSLFGLNNVVIRFLPTSEQRNRLVSTSFAITSIGSIFTSVVFLVWAYMTHSPVLQLGSLMIVGPILMLFVFLQTTGILFEAVFVAQRDAKYILFKNSIFSVVKLILPFVFAFLGAVGVVYSIAGAALAAWFVSAVSLFAIGFRYIRPHITSLSQTIRFAAGNYIANAFSLLPSSLLPLIITSRLGAQEAAFFYMPLMIITLINVIPSANAQTLFAEASHDEQHLPMHLRRALHHLFIFLIPSVLAVEICGYWALNFFGNAYATSGTSVLQILALASFVGSLNYFGDTILNIKKHSGLYVVMNVLNAMIIMTLSYFSAPYGLVAIAVSWLVAQCVTLLIYISINYRLVMETMFTKQPNV